MANRKDNIKSLFSNTRTRVIIVFTTISILIAVTIGYLKLHGEHSGILSSAVSKGPTGIKSIPGAIDPTVQYAHLQEQQNEQQAVQASTKGNSAIPTIIRTQSIGQGVGVIGSQSGVGFAALAREDDSGAQRSLWVQTLQNGNCSKSAVSEVLSQGAQLSDLKSACSCVQLKDDGYDLKDLEPVCACKELKAAGYNARQLKDLGYSAERLRDCGFDACELRNAGFTAQQMKDGGFTDGELKGAGFSEHEISAAGGLPAGITAGDVRKAGCDADTLNKLRQAGTSASAVRRISGCSAEQLKAAGFTAQQLKDAGFSAADLKKAGFTPSQLKEGGYSARDLLNAGYKSDDLANAGYTDAQIKAGQAELPPGITASDVKNAGCSAEALKRQREAGVSATLIKQYSGCNAQALKSAGFSDADLKNAGFTPQDLSAANTPISDEAIKEAACDPVKLKQLYSQGASAERIKKLNGCSAQDLSAAGYNDKLFSANPANTLADGRVADCSAAYLRKAKANGLSAATIHQTLGCSASALKDAGFTTKDLKAAGFTAAELKKAGFSAGDLKAAGFSPKEMKDAGFSAAELKAAGVSAKDLKEAGFSAAELKAAGVSAKDLKEAGFSAAELNAAGVSAKDLQEAGYTADQLSAAGFKPQDSSVAVLSQSTSTSVNPNITPLPSVPGAKQNPLSNPTNNNVQLQAILKKQDNQLADQKYQQKIQLRTSNMNTAATQLLQSWKTVSNQTFVAAEEGKGSVEESAMDAAHGRASSRSAAEGLDSNTSNSVAIKTGDILFAVMDTAVNSDEPGPILATIVSGKFKGTKLIGSFNLPSHSNSMVITFNTMSIPGLSKTVSISSFAIDPNTARTALSSRTDHHYLMRYGSLFASSFMEGFGNAFQSANTTVTVGGSGTNNVTVSNGVGRSSLENAVIGLATVGKSWGQASQQLFSTPVTVEVYAGTGIGVLFTQDVTINSLDGRQ
jgi:intracellular multiplication protein IcmE